MRKTIMTLCGIAGLLVIFALTASAQARDKNFDILIPLHVGAKGWMQALADQGYKPSLVCKLRYADGSLVHGSEAWNSPETVYITFEKDTKVSRAELAQFLKQAAGSRYIPILGEPVLANALEQKKAQPVRLPSPQGLTQKSGVSQVKDTQMIVTSSTPDPAGATFIPATPTQGESLQPETINFEMVGILLTGAILVLMLVAFGKLLRPRQSDHRWHNTSDLAGPKTDTPGVPFLRPAEVTSARSVEDIQAEVHLDTEILQPRESAVG